MNLLLSADQASVVDAIRGFLADAAPISRFRPPASQIGNTDHLMWPRLAEMGLIALSLPIDEGGAGLGIPEEALACREFGRYLLSPAILGMVFGSVLAASIDDNLRKQIAAGETRVGVATRADGSEPVSGLMGTYYLLDASRADWILLVDRAGCALLERSAFVDSKPCRGTDSVVALELANLGAALSGRYATAGVEFFDRARLGVAAYCLGLAEATRDMAVEYAKTRQQFGKPIGAFQSIKHLCAEMAMRTEAALCQVTYASLIVATAAPGTDFQSTAAKLVSVDAALQNAAKNIQVHGAIGFTAEADAHHFLKRAHLMDQLWGDIRRQREFMLAADFPD